MDRRNFFKILAALPFLGNLVKNIFTLKGNGQRVSDPRVQEGERIKLPDTGEIFIVKSVTDSSDRFGNPVKVIKIDTI